MKIQPELILLPNEIEKRSFEIISEELGDRMLSPENEAVIKRVIHTSADFDYADNLVFSPHAVQLAVEALREGTTIVTDTQMARAGINKAACEKLNCRVECFMADEDVAIAAKANGTTRAVASMQKAAKLAGNLIFAIGNAPTALLCLQELIDSGELAPRLVIGVPVGFVNVVESKELLLCSNVPHIVARGRKGGSNVAAAICNALLYQATDRIL
ncbi:MAG: precorrin-8X methylmutase [Angelakisella sp.]